MILLDDHLLRDWMVGPDAALRRAVRQDELATTNLWYARLCKTASGRTGGSRLAGWDPDERAALVGALVRLPEQFEVVPMRDIAWRMGQLVTQHGRLSTLHSEAVAAAETLGARLLVSSRDDGPGIRECCRAVGVRYTTLAR